VILGSSPEGEVKDDQEEAADRTGIETVRIG